MPDEPHGDRIVSADVFDHTAVEAFRNAGVAFAVCVDDEKGCVWVARRGRTPDPDVPTEAALMFALYAVNRALAVYGTEHGGSFAPGDA
jgi:hypothetical protein